MSTHELAHCAGIVGTAFRHDVVGKPLDCWCVICTAQRTSCRLFYWSGWHASVPFDVIVVFCLLDCLLAPRTLFVPADPAHVEQMLLVVLDRNHLTARLTSNQHRAFFPVVHVHQ